MNSTVSWLLASALVAATLFGCDARQPGRASAGLELEPCGREVGAPPPAVNGAECGSLSVPISPQASDGNTIDIAIKRWPAISAVPEPDPVFVIAGGPGQSAIGVSDNLVQAFFNLRKKRDIVFVDQRGTGDSAGMYCEDDENSSLATSMLENQAEILESLERCAQKHSELAPYVTTPYAVKDLETVRKALGYQRINLWGGSYGTRVALEYMRRYPEVLRSAVLDGLAPVSLAIPFRLGQGANRALAKVAEQCLTTPDCESRYGDIQQIAERVAARLTAEPIRLDIADPMTGDSREILLDVEKFASLVRFALYDRVLSRTLPHAVARADTGDYSLVASLISQFLASSEMPSIAMGMHLSVLCSEDVNLPQQPDNQPFLGVPLSKTLLRACELWSTGSLPEDYFEPVESSVPTLLLSGERDPVTPPEWGEQVSHHLNQSVHLAAPGAHHGVTRQGCGATLMTEFIRDLSLTDELRQCVNKITPMPFYLSSASGEATGVESTDKELGID